MIKKILFSPLFWIFLLALVVRTYKLGIFPVGLHVDEIRVGWNAFSILTTGRDDQGHFLPITYNSFGDYRPMGIFYLTIPSLIAFGRTIFAIRFPSALFGALSVFPIYQLVVLIAKDKKKKVFGLNTGHLAAILLALSPWHIEISRATSESVISIFFALYSLYFFIKLIKNGEKRNALLASLFIFISCFLYYPIRALGPIFFIIVMFIYFKDIVFSNTKRLIFLCFVAGIFSSLILTTTNGGTSRLGQVSILKDPDLNYELNRIRSEDVHPSLLTRVFDNKFVIYGRYIIQQYGDYFSSDFLIGYSAKPHRYTTPGTGLLNYTDIFLVLFGLTLILQDKSELLPLMLLVVSPLPAVITIDDAPNLQRAVFMLPFLIIIESYGLAKILEFGSKISKKISFIIFSTIALNVLFFIYMYFSHSINLKPFIKDYYVESGTYRNVGAINLSYKIESLQNDYDKIIVTSFPDSPYPWYAFFTEKDPKIFNKTYQPASNERNFENIVFSTLKCPTDEDFEKYKGQKILVIDNWQCDYKSQLRAGLAAQVVSTINRLDGTEAYILLENTNQKQPTN